MKKRRGLANRDSSRLPRNRSVPRLERVEDRILMAIFDVTSRNDALNAVAGDGTLRGEILASNATTTANELDFTLPSGVQTIALKQPLPPITDTLFINGTTATGFTNKPLIQVTGLNPSFIASGPAFTVQAQGSEIRDLIINNFSGDAIDLNGGKATVDGNYIGIDPTGSMAEPNTNDGILVASANNTIGGNNAPNPNVISANGGNAVEVNGTNAGGNSISGNYIGTNAAGTAALFGTSPGDGIAVSTPNNIIGGLGGFGGLGNGNLISGNQEGLTFYTGTTNNVAIGNFIGTDITGKVAIPNVEFGVYITGGTRTTIGGINSGDANVISGNGSDGVRISGAGSTSDLIEGNLIGVGSDGTTPLGNAGWGVQVNNASNNVVGGTTFQGNAPAYGNVIENNATGGVTIVRAVNDGILSNSIYQNGSGPGIALNGANNGIAAPVITSAQSGAGQTRITGSYAGAKGTAYLLQFFYSVKPNKSGVGDGQNYILGDLTILTNSVGIANFNAMISPQVPVGDYLTATATQAVLVMNNTSDFSTAYQVTQAIVSDLAVTTSVPNTGPQLDQPYTYTLTVSNKGPNDSSDAVLTDTLPTNSTVVSVSGGSVAGGILTDDLGALGAGASDTITIIVKPTTIGNFVNTATVTGPNLDPDLSNNTSTTTSTVVPDADLNVVLTPSVTVSPIGSPLTYTLAINNFGPSTANGTVVTVQFPADFTNIVVQPDQGSYSISGTNLVTINTGILPASSSSLVTLTATPTVVESAQTFVQVSSPVADPNPNNNTTSATVLIGNAADLGVTIAASPNPVLVGQELLYTVVVGNNGPSAASEPVVTDTLPAGVTYDPNNSTAGPNGTISETNGVVTASLNALLSGSTDTITIAVIPTASGLLNNTANVADPTLSNSVEIDPDLSNNSASVSVPVSPADLQVTVINPSDPLFINNHAIFQVQVQNLGPATATNVLLADSFGGGGTIVAVSTGTFQGSNYSANLGTLAAGATDTVDIIVNPTQSGTLTDQATVSSDEYDPDPSNNTSGSSNVVSPADLGIVVAGSPTPVLFGTTVIYVITVTNYGPSTATNVMFADALPNAILQGLVTSQGVVAPSPDYTAVFGNLGTLAAGASAQVTIAMLPYSTGSASDTAYVAADNVDPNSSNNSSTFTIPIFNQPGSIQFAATTNTFVADSTGYVGLLVDRTGGTSGTVSATYTTQGTNGVAGINFVGESGTVTFAPGQTVALIVLQVLNDGQVDGNHGFWVILSSPTGGASIGQVTTAGVVVVNTNRDLIPPIVTSLLAIPNGNQIDGFALTFDKALDPTRAQLLSNYYVFLSGSGAVNVGTPVALAAAEYDPQNNTVVLVPTAPLPSNRFYEIVANGSFGTAITDTSGNLLYGSSGPASNYVAYYGQGTQLVYDDSQGNQVTLNLTGGGIMGIYRDSVGDAAIVNLYQIVPHATKLTGSVKKLSKNASGHTFIGEISGLGAFGDVNSTLTTPGFYVGSAPVSAASVGGGKPVSLSVSAESTATTTAAKKTTSHAAAKKPVKHVTAKKATPKGPHHSKH